MMICTIAVAHQSEYPTPIAFNAGERVSLGRRDTEYPGWVRVTTAGGNAWLWVRSQSGETGWMPASTIDA